jgi:hypothetical protein
MLVPGAPERVFSRYLAVGRWDLPPARHTELLSKRVGVSLSRARRDVEVMRDLLVRAACRNQGDDLALPGGDPWSRTEQCSGHARRLVACRLFDH